MRVGFEEFEAGFVKFIRLCLETTSINLQLHFFYIHKIDDSLRRLNGGSSVDLKPLKS